ncbi:hypothetical protein BIW11_03675 [Tropilaelaps mercedesae]|uniref:Uncharacterized protein n=1 Tax=Tropilaelaps mercedesae TaxID=418985 RepID=A0A1V9XHI1_9ACAR|nr:hypothetical protein BIW11_03675 [Tropilaelaps mercedesae]
MPDKNLTHPLPRLLHQPVMLDFSQSGTEAVPSLQREGLPKVCWQADLSTNELQWVSASRLTLRKRIFSLCVCSNSARLQDQRQFPSPVSSSAPLRRPGIARSNEE